jgi:hypothetical protein
VQRGESAQPMGICERGKHAQQLVSAKRHVRSFHVSPFIYT